MTDITTIQLKKTILVMLKEAKEYERQTYNELLEHMAKQFIELKKRNHYDEFLHKVQQPKVRELWDNPEDEGWDDTVVPPK